MNSSKKYYKDLDLIRLVACIAVFLYHLGILKGGYLAVCIFFVLSGYLSFNSSFNKEKFSILNYYFSRLKKIYLPLLIVVFLTIFTTNLIPNIFWLNLKPETTSVLLGYNNFWQIGANLDYFARHANSPFIHFWYIAILLQFDLIFPFIFIIFKKIKDRVNKLIPSVVVILMSVGFTIYFYISSLGTDIMVTYYNSFTRIFSILFGLSLGIINSYYGVRLFKKITPLINKVIFYVYLLILIVLFILVDSTSKYFALSMILLSFIACRLIICATFSSHQKISFFDKIIKSFSSISYEVYLLQYPIIYFFQNINLNINVYLKTGIIIILVFILAYVLNFSLNLKNKKWRILRIGGICIISFISLLGFYHYLMTEDYTDEMKKLEKQLAENQKLVEEKQNEYEIAFRENEQNWLNQLENLELGEKEIANVVANLSVVGIGDSIMLGAITNLYNQFPNGYFDAKTSRTAWVANGILQNLKSKKKLGEPIIINLGANGDCPQDVKIKILKTVGNRKVFWVNVTNDKSVNVNKDLNNLAMKYANLYVVDWNRISKGHPEYFVADRIHLSETGKKVYTKAIYDKIYQVYLDEYKLKKQEIINKHELESKNKITFYGNNILLNAFNYLKKDFADSKFVINNNFDFSLLKREIEISIDNETLTNKIVLAFDNTSTLTKDEYQKLINLCSHCEIYLLVITQKSYNELKILEKENVKIINFYDEIGKNNNYLMVDRIHLSDEGNKALNEFLKKVLSEDLK